MVLRIKIISVVFLLSWLILISRLFYWQVKNANSLIQSAKQQQFIKKEISSPRGTIVSSDNFPLAISKQVYFLIVRPNLVKEGLGEFYEKIANISKELLVDKEAFVNEATSKKLSWYLLGKRIEAGEKGEIEKLGVEGIELEPQWQRFYPEASMAAHLLGFVGSDDLGNEKGYFGLEGYYNRELKGLAGQKIWEKDLLGRQIIFGEGSETKPRPGRNLVTSLDRSVQFLVEEKLKEGIEKYQAISGTAVMMDPVSGKILAMASFPAYDPVKFAKTDPHLYVNPAISFSFEPGSIFKPIVMAAAVDLNLVKPSTVCDICSGPIKIGEYTIRTWNDKYFGRPTMTEVIQHSDNTGMVFVSRLLGRQNLLNYLKKFGLGQKTGIDLEDESTPALRDDKEWVEIDLATAGFGQGIAVTPIQMTRAMASIANGGYLPTPKVVEKILSDDRQITLKETSSKRVLKSSTTKIITQMLVNAVEMGEAKGERPKGYKIAGKTGTAQVPVAGHYDEKKTIASFIGFAPADKPRFVLLVTLNEPKTSPWGSRTAAPIWFEIATEVFRVWGIPPE